MKTKLISLVSSAMAMVSLAGCLPVEGQKPKYCEPGSSPRCPYVPDAYGDADVAPTPAPVRSRARSAY